MKKRILTGDRPTGPLHLGHYVGSLANRVRLQDEYECFFIIADYQVLTDHLHETKKIATNIQEIVLDYLSVGIDPNKSIIFVQSLIPEIAELTMYLSFMVTVPRLQRNPTVKEEMQAARVTNKELTYGFLGYPVSQAADILIVRANLVPVGEDQLPHLEQTREIARTFNRRFGGIFPVPDPLLSQFPRLPGIEDQKMSKTRNNAINLRDTPAEVAEKVRQAYTDPTRIRATDPGHIEGNVVFSYLDAFMPDPDELKELKDRYRAGKVGDVSVKRRLTEVLNGFLAPIRERRSKFEAKPEVVKEILCSGIERTRKEARETMKLVREAMHTDYRNLLRSSLC